MNENLPFWNELSKTVMLRGTEWRDVVDSLPGRIDASEAKVLLQSTHQLASCNMQGRAFLAGAPVFATADSTTIGRYLQPDRLTVENLAMQWLFQFIILESIGNVHPDKPLAEWPPMFLDMYERGLHFMVYMAALMCLIEESDIDRQWAIPVNHFLDTEGPVRGRVDYTTKNLYKKAQDYGESFRRHGVMGLLPRLWDKIARYTQLKSENRDPNFEPLLDSARDLLGYSAIAWSLVLEIPAAQNIQKTKVMQ